MQRKRPVTADALPADLAAAHALILAERATRRAAKAEAAGRRDKTGARPADRAAPAGDRPAPAAAVRHLVRQRLVRAPPPSPSAACRPNPKSPGPLFGSAKAKNAWPYYSVRLYWINILIRKWIGRLRTSIASRRRGGPSQAVVLAGRPSRGTGGSSMLPSQDHGSLATPLGSNLVADGCTFRVWAPRATKVHLVRPTADNSRLEKPTDDNVLIIASRRSERGRRWRSAVGRRSIGDGAHPKITLPPSVHPMMGVVLKPVIIRRSVHARGQRASGLTVCRPVPSGAGLVLARGGACRPNLEPGGAGGAAGRVAVLRQPGRSG